MPTMKAVRFHAHGGPDRLLFEDAEIPVPQAGETLIKVRAAAVNRLDLWVRQGIPAYPVNFPHILGSDVCGEIAGGEIPSGFAEGDVVVVYPVLSCGQCRACTAGLENRCAEMRIIGGHVNGGYAQYVCVPSRNVIKKPASLSLLEGAAFPLTFLTAWHMLATRAQLREGETVLVLGASSGIGVAGIQIARYLGAHVIAATTHESKAERLKALGADEVLVSHPQDLGPKVLDATNQNGVEVVMEHIGPATWDTSLKVVSRGGRIVTCGATTGPEVPLVLRQLFGREITLLGAMVGTLDELKRLSKLINAGSLKPVVDRVFPLEQARQAQEALLAKEHVGKIVLDVAAKDNA